MSYELDRDNIMKFIIDNLPPAAADVLREKDYWVRSMRVVEDGLRGYDDLLDKKKEEACPWCEARPCPWCGRDD